MTDPGRPGRQGAATVVGRPRLRTLFIVPTHAAFRRAAGARVGIDILMPFTYTRAGLALGGSLRVGQAETERPVGVECLDELVLWTREVLLRNVDYSSYDYESRDTLRQRLFMRDTLLVKFFVVSRKSSRAQFS